MSNNWVYGVYDMNYKEQCVLITDNLKEVAKYLDIKYHTLIIGMQRGSTVKRRYKVIKIEGVNEE